MLAVPGTHDCILDNMDQPWSCNSYEYLGYRNIFVSLIQISAEETWIMCGMCRAVERFQTKCQQNKPCIKGRILLSEGIIACRPILGLYIYINVEVKLISLGPEIKEIFCLLWSETWCIILRVKRSSTIGSSVVIDL